MDIAQSRDAYESASAAWQEAMERNDYHSAIKAGIDAYFHYRAAGGEVLAKDALALVYMAIGQMLHLEDPGIASAACSFCGRPRSEEVELGAGPNAYICAECVELFHQILKPTPPKA